MSTVAYVANGSCVTIIDTSNHSIVATITTDSPTCLAVTPDGSLVYVANASSNNVIVIDTSTHTIMTETPIPVGPGPNRIVMPDGATAYVVHEDDTVSVIDTDRTSASFNTVIAAESLADVPLPSGMAVTPDGSRAWVANDDDSTISVIDVTTGELVATVSTEGFNPHHIALSADGTRAYVSADPGSVLVVDSDPASESFLTVIHTITVGGSPKGIALCEIPVSHADAEPPSDTDTAKPASRIYVFNIPYKPIITDPRAVLIEILEHAFRSPPINPPISKEAVEAVAPKADLAITQTVTKRHAKGSLIITYTTWVKNNGPDLAYHVRLSASIPSNTGFAGASATKGQISHPPYGRSGAFTCTVGSMKSGARIRIVIRVEANENARIIRTITKVTSATPDPNPNNNTTASHEIWQPKPPSARKNKSSQPGNNASERKIKSAKSGSKSSGSTSKPTQPSERKNKSAQSRNISSEPKNISSGQRNKSSEPRNKSSEKRNKSSEPSNKSSEARRTPSEPKHTPTEPKSSEVQRSIPEPTSIFRPAPAHFIVRKPIKKDIQINKPRPRPRIKRGTIGPVKLPLSASIKQLTDGKKIIGAGARRVVYDLGNGYVLKVAKSKDGIRSNKKEVTIYQSSPSPIRRYIANVKDYAPGYSWIVMEKYDVHFPHSQEYRQKLSEVRAKFRETGIVSYEVTDRQGRPNYQNLRLKHNGEIVVIDYGNFVYRS